MRGTPLLEHFGEQTKPLHERQAHTKSCAKHIHSPNPQLSGIQEPNPVTTADICAFNVLVLSSCSICTQESPLVLLLFETLRLLHTKIPEDANESDRDHDHCDQQAHEDPL